MKNATLTFVVSLRHSLEAEELETARRDAEEVLHRALVGMPARDGRQIAGASAASPKSAKD